jgi:hypothetical protein
LLAFKKYPSLYINGAKHPFAALIAAAALPIHAIFMPSVRFVSLLARHVAMCSGQLSFVVGCDDIRAPDWKVVRMLRLVIKW